MVGLEACLNEKRKNITRVVIFFSRRCLDLVCMHYNNVCHCCLTNCFPKEY